MKTKDKVIIGGAIVTILYLLNEKKKCKEIINEENRAGGSGNYGYSTTPLFPLFSSSTSAKSTESANLDLPSNMDLPNLTPSTSTPTEVAIQESVSTTLTPAIVEPVKETIEQSLGEYIKPLPQKEPVTSETIIDNPVPTVNVDDLVAKYNQAKANYDYFNEIVEIYGNRFFSEGSMCSAGSISPIHVSECERLSAVYSNAVTQTKTNLDNMGSLAIQLQPFGYVTDANKNLIKK